MDKILFIGRTHAGKTTLIQNLVYGESHYRKTQSIEHLKNYIDSPGEYIEQPRFYNALFLTSYDAKKVVFVMDALDKTSVFPPNFASAFRKEVVGVITKLDLTESRDFARDQLEKAGVDKIFEIDYKDRTSVEDLKNYLTQD